MFKLTVQLCASMVVLQEGGATLAVSKDTWPVTAQILARKAVAEAWLLLVADMVVFAAAMPATIELRRAINVAAQITMLGTARLKQ